MDSVEKKLDQDKTRLDSLERNKNVIQQDITSLKTSSQIPIGFLYTQLAEQSSPQQLWPSLQWTEVTQQYAGLFFRAEGSGSLPFGQTQQDNAPHLVDIKYHYQDYTGQLEGKIVNMKTGEWNDVISGDMFAGSSHKLMHWNMHISEGDVRPKNMAIKIWKRTK